MDTERRAALQLALLAASPRLALSTGTGETALCFLCKQHDHAGGCACGVAAARGAATGRERERLQHCPTCRSPAARTIGCASMLCVCGKYWEWKAQASVGA